MMNKGLEVIEAKWFFNMDINSIDVIVHPQSIVHSMIEFIDGALGAQMGIPDMKVPIAYALTYPERIINDLPALNLAETGSLEFRKPDMKKFPCLKLAYEAALCGGTAPVVLNAADEIAVSAFIENKIRFSDLPEIIEKILNCHNPVNNPSLDDILQTDLWAKRETGKIIERIKK